MGVGIVGLIPVGVVGVGSAGRGVDAVEGRQAVEVAQAGLDVLHVHLDVVAQRRHVRLVQRFAQVVQRVVQRLQFVGVAFALRKALDDGGWGGGKEKWMSFNCRYRPKLSADLHETNAILKLDEFAFIFRLFRSCGVRRCRVMRESVMESGGRLP